MICGDYRDLFSALVDDALAAEERAALDAHLSGCADCRRELERFRRTVAALHGLGPERAPMGFVDRVLVAAHRRPWSRRLATGLFRPMRVMLPLQAAAMLLVAGLALYLYQHSPELQQAARQESPASPPSPGASLDRAPGLGDAPAAADVAPGSAPKQQPSSGQDMAAQREAREPQKAERDTAAATEGRRHAAKVAPPGVPPGAAPLEPAAAPPSAPISPPAPASALAPAESAVGRAADAVTAPDRPERRGVESAAPAPPPEPKAMSKQREERVAAKESTLAAAPPIIESRLLVTDMAAAERSLAELLPRVEATEISRRSEAGETLVELTVPGERWPALRDGLDRLGRLHLKREPAPIPARVTLRLRISG